MHSAEAAADSSRQEILDRWSRIAIEFEASWFGPDQAELFARVDAELLSLSAIGVGASAPESRILLAVYCALWPYLTRDGLGREAETRMAEALDRTMPDLDADTAVRTQWVRAWLAYDTMALDRVNGIIEQLSALARTPAHRALVAQILGIQALYNRDPATARARLLESYDYHRINGHPPERFIDLSFLAATASAAEDPDLAYDYCEQTLALCDEHGEHLMRGYVIWAFALSAWRAKDHHRAFVLALDGASNSVEVGDHHAAAICIDIAAWYVASQHRFEDAARLIGFSEALRLSNRLPSPYLGTDVEHKHCVDSVLAGIGTGPFLERLAETRHATLSDVSSWITRETSPPSDESAPPRLTPRQYEIAALIAEGLTNKEVARRLLISVSTVETHIEHVFRKLNVVSRAQVAVWIVAQAGRD